MQSSRPPLLIVSGAPASGKTTLARRLATDLRMPLFEKDRLKERLSEQLGAPADVPASQRLGLAAYAMLFLVARQVLAVGTGVMIESNFRRGVSEPELESLESLGAARLVHCTAAADTIVARYRDRSERGQRHAAHLDGQRAEALADDLRHGLFEPLELACPQLIVEVEDDYRPGYPAILGFAGAHART